MNHKWSGRIKAFCDSLGIEHPIIQAPMAGGPSTPELIAAVSNAGGLGSMGAGYLAPEVLDGDIKKVKALTDKPFAVNLFIPDSSVTVSPSMEILEKLESYSDELGIDMPEPPGEPEFTFHDQLQVVLDNEVPVFSFTFGVPESRHMEELHKRGVSVIGTATSVQEGIRLEKAGCKAVTAQGSEAGGHRGTFIDTESAPMIGGIALIPQLADRLGIPVIASGGIMDGRGIAAALALGASAVQIGTAFLGCEEAGIPEAWLDAMQKSKDTDTTITNAFTGKNARGIRNKFIEEMSRIEGRTASYPLQHHLTKSLRAVSKSNNNPEYMSLWAGQGAPLIQRTKAKDLMEKLVRETKEVIENLSSDL